MKQVIPSEYKEKFIKTRDFLCDPFPQIPPALLNSAHIKKYAGATSMVYPFHPEDCKIASLRGRIGGDYQYWDGNGKLRTGTLAPGGAITIEKNSIAFIPVMLFFQLPNYIAVRFNLRRKHAYKGLLLGTGPLIDPGFRGKIYIPLHNLTGTEYTFHYGDDLVEFEFTKTSHPLTKEERDSLVEYDTELEDNRIIPLSKFIEAAVGAAKVVSSIPEAVIESRKHAESAARTVKWFAIGGVVGALGLFVGLAVGWIPVYLDLNSQINDMREQISTLSTQVVQSNPPTPGPVDLEAAGATVALDEQQRVLTTPDQ